MDKQIVIEIGKVISLMNIWRLEKKNSQFM